MQRHLRADGQADAQRPMRFDPVDIDHGVAFGHGDIAGLADLSGQPLQDRHAFAAQAGTAERVGRDPAQLPAGDEAAPAQIAHQPAVFLKRLQQAVGGGFGQAQHLADLGRGKGGCGLGDGFQDVERAQVGLQAAFGVVAPVTLGRHAPPYLRCTMHITHPSALATASSSARA